jgi:hypothetical protein
MRPWRPTPSLAHYSSTTLAQFFNLHLHFRPARHSVPAYFRNPGIQESINSESGPPSNPYPIDPAARGRFADCRFARKRRNGVQNAACRSKMMNSMDNCVKRLKKSKGFVKASARDATAACCALHRKRFVQLRDLLLNPVQNHFPVIFGSVRSSLVAFEAEVSNSNSKFQIPVPFGAF